MKDALAKGKEFFVITSVYEAQKAFVKVSHTHKGQDIYESQTIQINASSGGHEDGSISKGGNNTKPDQTKVPTSDSSSGKSVSENAKDDNDIINADTKGITS